MMVRKLVVKIKFEQSCINLADICYPLSVIGMSAKFHVSAS